MTVFQQSLWARGMIRYVVNSFTEVIKKLPAVEAE